MARIALPVVVALAVFWLAFRNGTYALTDWTTAATVIWCGLAGSLVLGLLPIHRVPLGARWVGLLFTAFVAYTGISAVWASGAEPPYQAMGLGLLYLGVFAVTVAVGSPAALARWTNGLAIGIVSIALLALSSRLFPGHLQDSAILQFLPEAHTRLSYPIGYWNGLAILAALACPLLLRAAVGSARPAVRGLAVALLPAVISVIYFASSRTGLVTAVVGSLTFLALSSRRLETGVAAISAAASAVGAVVLIQSQHALIDGPLDSAAASRQGWHTAIAIAGLGLAAAAAHLRIGRFVAGKRVPSTVARALAGVAVAALALAVAASHPIRHWHSFTRPPALSGSNYIQNHFLSTNGNWRWQYWRSAVDEFRAHPLFGGGSRSFAAWWAQHGRLVGFITNAHSLYFNTLAELGLIGLLLVTATFALGGVTAVRRALRAPPDLRNAAGAAAAGFIAFAVAAGLDWVWELPVVGIVGAALLGLAVGPSTQTKIRQAAGAHRPKRTARALALAFCIVVAVTEIDMFATDAELRTSRAAVAGGNLSSAESAARDAQRLAPWTSSPYVQLALVQEAAGRLGAAQLSIDRALAHESRDWRLWLISTRIATKRGDIATARKSFEVGRQLNPRSSLFAP